MTSHAQNETKKIIRKIISNDVLIDGKNILHGPILNSDTYGITSILENDKTKIGRSILEFSDLEGYLPLHRAIKTGNIETLVLLLEYTNPQQLLFQLPTKNNSLHYSIQNNNDEITKIIIDKFKKENVDLSVVNGEGNNALHLACMMKNTRMSEYLLKRGIDVNAKNYTDEFTPLNYVKTADFADLLVFYGSNINEQDFYGNTILHYSFLSKNDELSDYLLTLEDLNVNLFNIYMDLPIHIFVTNISKTKKNIFQKNNLRKLIKSSILNFQNKNGESPFFLLVKHNLWKEYKQELKVSKLDILVKTKSSESIFDFIKFQDMEEFKNIVVDSYYHRLQSSDVSHFRNEWENICSAVGKTEITPAEKNTLAKLSGVKSDFDSFDLADSCRSIIHKYISSLLKMKDTEHIDIYRKSYPVPLTKLYLDIQFDNDVSFCTFMGLKIDILFGLLYIISEHDNVTSPINENLMNIASDESSGFEILWKNNNLVVDKLLLKLLRSALLNKRKRFIIIPLGIELENNAHSNYLIYDKKLNELERFEPYGCSSPQGFNYKVDLLDERIKSFFSVNVSPKIKYFRPKDFMDKICFQHLDTIETDMKKFRDPTGFCAVWSIWYVDMRTKYYDVQRKELINRLLKNIISQNYSFKQLIRGYSEKIVKLRNRFLEYGKITINDWVNENYTKSQVSVVNELLKNYVKNIMAKN